MIWGEFHDNFLEFSGFGLRRKLAFTKTKQDTDKESKYNGYSAIYWNLVLCMHQQKWRQLTLLYPLSSLHLPSSQFFQLTFSPHSARQDTDDFTGNTCMLRQVVHWCFRHRRSLILYAGAGPISFLEVLHRETETNTDMDPLLVADRCRSTKGETLL